MNLLFLLVIASLCTVNGYVMMCPMAACLDDTSCSPGYRWVPSNINGCASDCGRCIKCMQCTCPRALGVAYSVNCCPCNIEY